MLYKAFELNQVPRSLWTEIILNVLKLRTTLQSLEEMQPRSIQSSSLNDLSKREVELSSILKSSDSDYFDPSLRNRQTLRDLHSQVYELWMEFGSGSL